MRSPVRGSSGQPQVATAYGTLEPQLTTWGSAGIGGRSEGRQARAVPGGPREGRRGWWGSLTWRPAMSSVFWKRDVTPASHVPTFLRPQSEGK